MKPPSGRSRLLMAVPLVVTGIFLYGPIATLIAMSFNNGGSAFTWEGFGFRWYGELASDATLIEALQNSLIIATGATLIATLLGTLLAVGLARHTRSRLLEVAATAPAILPDLLLAIGLLSFFVLLGKWTPLRPGLLTVLLAHAAFGTAFVVAVVRTRLRGHDASQEEASRDLGAGSLTTFVHITLPAISPAVVAGALLTFTLSLDEFVIAFFTAGPTTQTLPIAIYSRVRTGITPEVNALATVLVAVTVVAFILGGRLLRSSEETS